MNSVKEITDQHCSGCGICTIVCSKAVSLQLNKDGYYKSRVDESKCIDCGACLEVCSCKSNPEEVHGDAAYIAYSKARNIAINSSSAGIAYLIARKYLDLGYVIMGAAWSENFDRVEHIVVRDKANLEKLRKSKYVQSYTPDAFSEIKDYDKVVVFGTPCQIAGIRKLYGNRSGLILVDFDCMGPAGYNLWNKYLEYLKTINKSGIKSLEMRNKIKSWRNYGTRVVFNDNQEYYKDKFHDPFCALYHMAHTIQDSCLKNCRFLNNTMADIRIGDAWNYTDGFTKEQIHDGLSIIVPQTLTGQEVIAHIVDDIVLKKTVKIPNKPILPGQEEYNIRHVIADPDTDIESAIECYNDIVFDKRLIRKLSYFLSSNDTLYLLAKKILRLFR